MAPAVYRPSSEHKQHPGPWGPAQWRKRVPALTPCPVDIAADEPARWLHQALACTACWVERSADDQEAHPDHPPHVYWWEPGRQQFYTAQRTERPHIATASYTYKGYPVHDGDVPRSVADAMQSAGMIDEEVALRLKRAR
ncbi:MAG: hypothetical protein AMXMBFR64_15160 [Myxococcales bacterium]